MPMHGLSTALVTVYCPGAMAAGAAMRDSVLLRFDQFDVEDDRLIGANR